jgi:hypothetical protein
VFLADIRKWRSRGFVQNDSLNLTSFGGGETSVTPARRNEVLGSGKTNPEANLLLKYYLLVNEIKMAGAARKFVVKNVMWY